MLRNVLFSIMYLVVFTCKKFVKLFFRYLLAVCKDTNYMDYFTGPVIDIIIENQSQYRLPLKCYCFS